MRENDIKDLRALQTGEPTICELFCCACNQTFAGAWRSEWEARECRYCKRRAASKMVDERIWRNFSLN